MDLAHWLILLALGVLGSIYIGFIIYRNRMQSKLEEADIDQIVGEAGFAYDERQDIFYSKMDAWQRKYGYSKVYDEASPPLSMIFDIEPVHFAYDNRNWLIEFWKGQYGMTTGAEIGVYYTENPVVNDFTFYKCADDEDLLPMSLTLRKNNKLLFRRSGVHWWLTGFVLGEFSEPDELEMDVEISFKDYKMRDKFINRLHKIGYRDLRISGHTVGFTISKPYSPQPNTRTEVLSRIQQKKNKLLCEQYKKIAGDYPNTYEALKAIKQKSPKLFSRIVTMGRPAELYRDYDLRKRQQAN
ncbi:MAG: DUF4474 domain-containing protein [Oscillospiraceae bacterium]|jgi:hypothetical protein